MGIDFLLVVELIFLISTGTNQTHISQKNVKKLGQFIERESSQNTAHRSNSGIIFKLEAVLLVLLHQFRVKLQVFLGVDKFTAYFIHVHASELEHAELLAVFADPGGCEENRANR